MEPDQNPNKNHALCYKKHFSEKIEITAVKKKLYLIFNPNSGKGKNKQTLPAILTHLSDFFDVEVSLSQSRMHARELARSITSSQNRPLIVAAGGDGTISDIVNGCRLDNVTLGIVPIGSVNIIADQLGIPSSINESCALIKKESSQQIDISSANALRFVFGAGVGFDGKVIEQVNLKHKLMLGKSIYCWTAMKVLPRFSPYEAEVVIDGKKVFSGRIFQVIVGKSRLYAGFSLFHTASLFNGLFDVAIFTHRTKSSFVHGYLNCFMHIKDKKLHFFRGRSIRVSTDRPVPYHIDGDDGNSTPVEFSLLPQSLKVIVPGQ